MTAELIIKHLGSVDYVTTQTAMQDFTQQRNETTSDECWVVEHPPVFTQGLAGKAEHVLDPKGIPVVRSDRGGQITYHGPGQLVVYFMWDLARLALNTRQYVILLEQILIDTCAQFGLSCYGDRSAPGVYHAGAKVASIGLRLRKQCSYHGVALNVENDLTPFEYINPCGVANQRMLALKKFNSDADLAAVSTVFIDIVHSVYQQQVLLAKSLSSDMS